MGGVVAILCKVGDNFGAGMTGGMAFVYDPDGRFESMANPDSIIWLRVSSHYWEGVLKALVEEHAARTSSLRAADLLAHWDMARSVRSGRFARRKSSIASSIRSPSQERSKRACDMSSWVVQKFGGSSVADAACFQRVAAIVEAEGERQAIVVSACSGVTDALLNVVELAQREGEAERALQDLRARHESIAAAILSAEVLLVVLSFSPWFTLTDPAWVTLVSLYILWMRLTHPETRLFTPREIETA